MRLPSRAARAALLIIFVAAVSVIAALPGSSAASGGRARAVAPTARPAAPPSVATGGARLLSQLPLAPALLVQATAAPIATYAADCVTPKSSFNLGEVVCAKTFGAPASGAAVVFSDPDNFQRGALPVAANAQSYLFTLPGTGTTDGVDNRGTWAAAVVNTNDNSRRAVAAFLVHDPQEPVADVTISKTALDPTQVAAGGDASFRVYVTNQGPDPAVNVTFTDNTLPNTTFVSFTQDSGPAFTCTPPAVGAAGATNCSAASMAVGAAASFTAVYKVSTSIGNGADLTDTVGVDSDTADSRQSSNSSTVEATATNANPPACTITCPANVTVDSTPGQAGAVVNYDEPATSGSCGAVTSDHPSGSFFPIGTTVVTTSVSGGGSCSFSVTVLDKRAVTITLNGSADMTVECRSGFSDPGASATDGTNSVPVTSAVTVPDPGGAVDQNGDAVQVPVAGVDPNVPNTYTITYTATKDDNTATAARLVRVVDTTPPSIALSNTAGFVPETAQVTVTNDDGTTSVVTETILVATVECHTSFTLPTASATDSCAGNTVTVTTAGAVDVDTPGVYDLVYTATDASGNDADSRVRVKVVDTVKPVITLNGPSTMSLLRTSPFTDPGATAADGCAGPVPVTVSGAVDTNVAGVYTLTYNATDPSGNAADPVTRTVTVYVYTFTGFFSPINNSAINQANAGRSIPVKFSLSGYQGMGIMAAGSPFSQQVTCGSTNVTDLQETGTAGSSSLSYDASSDQYHYVWKTESSWAGTCRVLTVKLDDGSTHTANFKFK